MLHCKLAVRTHCNESMVIGHILHDVVQRASMFNLNHSSYTTNSFFSSQFYGYKFLEYKERVVEGNYRPPINELLTSRVQELIKECWAPDPKKRPPFERICLSLRAAYEEAAKEQGCVDPGGVSRSVRLVNKSVRSFRMHVKRRSSNEMAAFEE